MGSQDCQDKWSLVPLQDPGGHFADVVTLGGMNTSHKLKIWLMACLCMWTCTLMAQTDSTRYVCITLQSGIMRCGTLTMDDGREVTLETSDMGKLIVPKADILRMVDPEPGKRGTTVMDPLSDRMVDDSRSLQATRYFFAPSAHSLKEGEGYGSFSLLTGGNVSYGLGENTIGGLSASWLGYGLNVKHSVNINEKTRFSFGALGQLNWSGISGNNGAGYVFFPFVNVTSGDENNHVTLGFGRLGGQRVSQNLFSGETTTDPIKSPMINLSGCAKVGRRAWLISENYFFFQPEFFPVERVFSVGIRVWNERKQRLNELAVLGLVEEDGAVRGLPWLSWTWPF